MAGRAEGAETARRAMALLEVIANTGRALLLDQLAERVALTKSTTYRLLRVLQDDGYVDRVDGGGYRLGSRFVGLAAAALGHMDLFAAVRPLLRELAEAAGETATLHRRSGAQTVLVLGAESEVHTLRRAARIGEVRPLYRGCAGQAILAHLDTPDAASVLRAAAADGVATDALERDLAEVRSQRYAVSHGANHPGVHGMAAPVLTGRGAGVGLSVAVSGPAQRWTPERMRAFVPRLLATCAQVAIVLGGQPLPVAPAAPAHEGRAQQPVATGPAR